MPNYGLLARPHTKRHDMGIFHLYFEFRSSTHGRHPEWAASQGLQRNENVSSSHKPSGPGSRSYGSEPAGRLCELK